MTNDAYLFSSSLPTTEQLPSQEPTERLAAPRLRAEILHQGREIPARIIDLQGAEVSLVTRAFLSTSSLVQVRISRLDKDWSIRARLMIIEVQHDECATRFQCAAVLTEIALEDRRTLLRWARESSERRAPQAPRFTVVGDGLQVQFTTPAAFLYTWSTDLKNGHLALSDEIRLSARRISLKLEFPDGQRSIIPARHLRECGERRAVFRVQVGARRKLARVAAWCRREIERS